MYQQRYSEYLKDMARKAYAAGKLEEASKCQLLALQAVLNERAEHYRLEGERLNRAR